MFHLPSFSLSLEWNLFLLLLHLSIIIPLEIVKVLLWEELKSGIPLKALIFFMFFMEANADLFFQSEINCYCNWFVLSCTDRCQGREESVRSGVWSWQPLCCESAQLLGNVFTHVLLWSSMLCHARAPLWGQHYSWAPCSFFHLDIISHSLPRLLARLQLSLRVADMEHSCYGWCWGSCCSDIVMLQMSSCNTAAVTQDVISFLVCWPSLPKICHLPWQSWRKKTCARTSAASVQIQLPCVSLALGFRLRCWTLKSSGV